MSDVSSVIQVKTRSDRSACRRTRIRTSKL